MFLSDNSSCGELSISPLTITNTDLIIAPFTYTHPPWTSAGCHCLAWDEIELCYPPCNAVSSPLQCSCCWEVLLDNPQKVKAHYVVRVFQWAQMYPQKPIWYWSASSDSIWTEGDCHSIFFLNNNTCAQKANSFDSYKLNYKAAEQQNATSSVPLDSSCPFNGAFIPALARVPEDWYLLSWLCPPLSLLLLLC